MCVALSSIVGRFQPYDVYVSACYEVSVYGLGARNEMSGSTGYLEATFELLSS